MTSSLRGEEGRYVFKTLLIFYYSSPIFCRDTLTKHTEMSDIKLTYFNARGRAETARLILAHAGNMMSPDPGGYT